MVSPDDPTPVLELPPLDGDDGETSGSEFDDPLAAVEADGADPYDDANAEEAGGEEPLAPLETESVLDDAPADVDIEAPALVERLIEIAASPDDDTPLDLDGGFDFDEGGPTVGADRGEEGFDEPDLALDESALPRLDQGDDAESDDGLFYEDDRESASDDLPFDRAWAVVARAPLGEVVQVAVAGARIDARLASGAALRSLDGGASFAATDLPPASIPAARGTNLRLPGDRVVSVRSGFDRCILVCKGADGVVRIVSDLSHELDADARDIDVHALAYDVGTRTLWLACRWGVVGLGVPHEAASSGPPKPVS